MVDDEPALLALLSEALTKAGYRVLTAGNAEQAIARIIENDFDLVFCDVRMPSVSGLTLSHQLSDLYPDLPVVMMTAYATAELAKRALRTGAIDFIGKPVQLDELPIVVERNLERKRLDLERSADRERRSTLEAAQALVSAIEARDPHTAGHSQRVTGLALRLGEALRIAPASLRELRLASQLHDLGKISIPDALLIKPGPLTPEEWTVIKRHPEVGSHILSNVKRLALASPTVLHHHERPDGRGYPWGLVGDAIPLHSRIIGLADAYEAMTTDRAYRPRMEEREAQAEIRSGAGSQFDPSLAEVFLEVLSSR